MTGSGWQCWLREDVRLSLVLLSTSCPSLSALVSPRPQQSGVPSTKLQGLRCLASDFRALVLSHLGRWQEPSGESSRTMSGPSHGSLVLEFGPLLGLRDIGVYASSHFSPVRTSVPAGPQTLRSGARVYTQSQGTTSTDVQIDVSNLLLPTGPFLPSRCPGRPGHRAQYHHESYCLVPLDLKKKNPRMGSILWQNMKYPTFYKKGTV